MQAYLEPEQAFSLSMPQPVFEISITYKKTCIKTKHQGVIFESVSLLQILVSIKTWKIITLKKL